MSATRRLLDRERWHFQHGPIDLVIGADGDPRACEAAHEATWDAFQTVLGELVSELATLRAPVPRDAAPESGTLKGRAARRMWSACQPYREPFITPMAAVAGSVSDVLIGHYQRPGVRRAFINNGGDIALWLAPRTGYRIGVVAAVPHHRAGAGALQLDAALEIGAHTPVRGIATSGWRGRSFSLGIADSVTVLARSAASADAAATVIANAVNVDDRRIMRMPANHIKDDTDLADRPVTTGVPLLESALIATALDRGAALAERCRALGRIEAAALFLQGSSRVVGARSLQRIDREAHD